MIMASARRRLFVAEAKAGLVLFLLSGARGLGAGSINGAGGCDRPARRRAGHGESGAGPAEQRSRAGVAASGT